MENNVKRRFECLGYKIQLTLFWCLGWATYDFQPKRGKTWACAQIPLDFLMIKLKYKKISEAQEREQTFHLDLFCLCLLVVLFQ